ncbi:MAG: phytanoyl-CoA dioxygenase family protein [Halieaceae bacterium]
MYEKQLEKDGVILLPRVINDKFVDAIRAEYDDLDATLTGMDEATKEPLVVFWRHVEGEQKRTVSLTHCHALKNFIFHSLPAIISEALPSIRRLQLLECIIFNKPPLISNTLNWHQDVAYFPLKPNNQIAVWFPLEHVNESRGAMQYALGSHRAGAMGSTNLHTREPFEGEDRPLIPKNPAQAGYEVKTFEMAPHDLLKHDGFTWHQSGPNTEAGHTRRGVSIRFITSEAMFDPRPGQGAAFTKQINVAPGEKLPDCSAFPVVAIFP